jgi:hypothetical protein
MPVEIICPACGQADGIEKVSTIYLVGSERQLASSKREPLVAQARPWLQELSTTERWTLSRRLAPPSSGKPALTRSLHPDLVVFTFSLMLPIFLLGMLNSQPVMLLPVSIFVVGAYGIYFWKRKAILARYTSKEAVQHAADKRAGQAIARWMRLYYCAQDDGVFIPGDAQLTPADQMPGYLHSQPAQSAGQGE